MQAEAIHDWQIRPAAVHEELQEPLHALQLQQKDVDDPKIFLKMPIGLGHQVVQV